MLEFTLTESEECRNNPAWKAFQAEHSAWLSARVAEGEALFALPTELIDSVESVWSFTDSDVQAERALAALCRRFQGLGILHGECLQYQPLSPSVGAPPSHMLDSMRDLGWSEQDVKAARELGAKGGRLDDIGERVKAAAGWLVCHPEFLAARDRLKQLWRDLPESERPSLALTLPLRSLTRPASPTDERSSDSVEQFLRELDAVCDTWRISGFATWYLPLPDGPQWPAYVPAFAGLSSDAVTLDTPWHFPLRAEDGFGKLVREEHKRAVNERGADDVQRQPETFGRLLEIDHWERVLRSRYTNRRRPRAFVTVVNDLLAELLKVSLDHIQRLRKLRTALQTGRMSSLPRRR